MSLVLCAGLLLCKPMQLIYGMGGDSWSEVIDGFIEMPLWVVRVYTHFSLKRAVRWLSLIVCVFVRTVYQFCVYVQTWVKQNLHTIHSDRFKECKMTGKQHTEKLNARQGNCIFARDLHPGLPLCYCFKISRLFMLPLGKSSPFPSPNGYIQPCSVLHSWGLEILLSGHHKLYIS